jgi:hypothetical protein
MKAVKILLVLAVVVAGLLGAALLLLERYLQSAGFKELMLAGARSALGSEVHISGLEISLFRGASLRGVSIRNPTGFDGELLRADAFVLRYRLLPLLRRRVEITRLSLEKPVLTLARNERGEWNYEKLAPQPGAGPAPPQPGRAAGPTGLGVGGLRVAVSRVAMDDGEIVVLGETGRPLARLQRLNVVSAVRLEERLLAGSGTARLETLAVADSLFVRELSGPVTISAEEVKVAPLAGRCAGGSVSGSAALKLAGGLRYVLEFELRDAELLKVLEEAGVARRPASGKLRAVAKLEGTGGLPTVSGTGRVEIVEGRLGEIPAVAMVATLLQMPQLRGLRFEECVLQFSIGNNVMETPVVRLRAPGVEVAGSGRVSLEDFTLDHTMTLAVSKELLARAPKEIRNVFSERADGSLAVEFRLWGPYDSPKQDLGARIARGAAGQLLEKGLQKLRR